MEGKDETDTIGTREKEEIDVSGLDAIKNGEFSARF